MASTSITPATKPNDLLAYLPKTPVQEHEKGQLIYTESDPNRYFHLVVSGSVRVSHRTAAGKYVIIDIYQSNDFFGEAAFLRSPPYLDEARALEDCRLMSWTSREIEQIALRQPRLAIALLQMMVERTSRFKLRIESLSAETMGERVANVLLRLANRAAIEPDGSVRLLPLTHQILAQYVGTSREGVTTYMNRLRREGYVRYSRQAIILYRDALQELIRREQTGQQTGGRSDTLLRPRLETQGGRKASITRAAGREVSPRDHKR